MQQINEGELFIVQINKREIINLNYEKIKDLLSTILEKDHTRYFQSVHFVFNGYNHDSREIYEINSIRAWAKGLVKKYPQIFFFLEQQQAGFQNILLCVSDIQLMEQYGQQKQLQVHLNELYEPLMQGLYAYEKNVRAYYLMERVYRELEKYR